jgi:hypothetical protein
MMNSRSLSSEGNGNRAVTSSNEPSSERNKVPAVTFEEIEQALRQRLEALPPAARAELRHVLRLPDFDRADRIGEFWGLL